LLTKATQKFKDYAIESLAVKAQKEFMASLSKVERPLGLTELEHRKDLASHFSLLKKLDLYLGPDFKIEYGSGKPEAV